PAAWYMMFKSGYGFRMQIWGTSPLFAKFAGYKSAANSYASLAISGALHSLTGFFAVTGCYYTCHKGFYANMGWNALNVALISSSNPINIIPVSLVLAWIYTSASRVALTQGFDFDIAGIVQGIILFAVSLTYLKRVKR
ncbi:MAG: ABC transporter permease, partial [Treponema sp.]|nr:ABC transporter permease [Treponema sp.]